MIDNHINSIEQKHVLLFGNAPEQPLSFASVPVNRSLTATTDSTGKVVVVIDGERFGN